MEKKLIFETDLYQLYGYRSEKNGGVAIKLVTVWPRARTDHSEHTQLQINLPADAAVRLADFIMGAE
jgi:hypothetical protein